MKKQTSPFYTILGALALLALGVLLGGGLGRSASAQRPAIPSGDVGRYRITATGSGMNPYVYLLDTQTGRCWVANSPGEAWHSIPSPK